MDLAIFDLDNTLLHGDSEEIWWDYLAKLGHVEKDEFHAERQKIKANKPLNVKAYVEVGPRSFTLFPKETLNELLEHYVQHCIKAVILKKGIELLKSHQAKDDYLLIITATNDFLAKPIAKLLEVDDLIATNLEKNNKSYTGKVIGTPSFREGKVKRLEAWQNQTKLQFNKTYFYSDSIHDLPLLEKVDYPVVVDANESLQDIAQENQWKILSLRD